MVYRAYSVLDVKALDAETRAIEGVATTPSTDRIGDSIEPRGATFAPAIPLLLFHDAKQPVGTVALRDASAAGINFRATLPTIAEAGRLRDRVEEAWQSVKAGLIRGVSIGFRALDDGIEFIKGGGLRFTKIEILELSLVAIPANADARIETIKAIDAPYVRSSTAMATPTTLEQITQFTAMRDAKVARMAELMNMAGAAGRTLDEAESTEYDTLDREAAEQTKHIGRLGVLETTNRAAAVAANGQSTAQAAASRAGTPAGSSPIFVRDNLPPGIEFTRVVLCKIAAHLFHKDPYEIARTRYPDNHRVQQHLQRAAVPAATTTDADWLGALVDPTNLTQEWLAWLRPQTIIGSFGLNDVPELRRVPFNVALKGQTSGATAYWVGQGKAKPLTNFTVGRQTLGFSKVATIAVITQELARFSSPSAEGLVRDELRDAIVERLDLDFIDPAHAETADVSPASITNGVTPLTSAGTTPDDIRADIAAILGTFVTTNQDVGQLVLIMPNTVALALSMMRTSLGTREFDTITLRGGTLEGIPVIASQYAHTAADGDMVIGLNAKSIGLADDGAVSVEANRDVSLEMSDTPVGDSGTPTGATSMVSMWQTNSIAIRAERFINWKKFRAGAVVWMEDVGWAGGSTGS